MAVIVISQKEMSEVESNGELNQMHHENIKLALKVIRKLQVDIKESSLTWIKTK